MFSFVFPMGAFAEEYLFFEDDYSETNYKEEWSPDELFEEQDDLPEENTVLEEIEDESESDATLEDPVINATPNMETAKVDDDVVITATVSGTTGTVAYQWQVSKDGGNTLANSGLTGNKTEELRFVATEARLANQYCCAVTDENGTWYSNAVQVELEKIIVWNNVLYEILTPSNCSVSSYKGNETTLVIPETVEGMTVTEIGEEAFMGNASLESIDLPDTIIIIRARAFKNCTNLREMK